MESKNWWELGGWSPKQKWEVEIPAIPPHNLLSHTSELSHSSVPLDRIEIDMDM